MQFSSIIKKINFDRRGLIPVIIQDAKTGEVLMMAYMNRRALRETLKTKQTCFWSRSRKTLWRKGETSGHIQKVRSIFLDCDSDTLLIKVSQAGAACHKGFYSCFYRELKTKSANFKVVGRKIFDPKKVYKK